MTDYHSENEPETMQDDFFDQLHPADAADHLENLPLEEQVVMVRGLPLEDAAESIAEMDSHDRIPLMTQLPPKLAADILTLMSPDDAADTVAELEPDIRKAIFRELDQEDAAEIKSLLMYDPDSAGGVMNTEILVLDENLTADQAITVIRSQVEDSEIPYYAYMVDQYRHLKGVLSLRDIMISPGGKKLKELLVEQNLIAVPFDTDKEEVAKLIARYNFLALPVVDHGQRILGTVTVDDVIDIIQEEASEDMQQMVGAGGDETIDSPWGYSLKMRMPWLFVNLLNSAVSAWVVHLFEGSIEQMAILAVLMPIVANQAGNTGQQSLAVMIRQLAMERFDRKKVWIAVAREAKIGLVNGLIIGLATFFGIILVFQRPGLAAVMALALLFDMLLGAIAGASIPLILKELGRDPAQASSIFLTTLTDSMGFFVFLGMAGVFLL
ncbi:magnesium transporter [Desulfoplanes formicivorans]|uniref:Magnesium transporter MgtE n=1 Tax=Desulfoplanes formicivorans TaxID=1592317 RepID=A0A194AGE4_9BACT|nr:magnesium transporter [Desulfoplanes formicivorans]